jgi:hypothetical protein
MASYMRCFLSFADFLIDGSPLSISNSNIINRISKIILHSQELVEMPEKLLSSPFNIVEHGELYPGIIDLLEADYHPEEMG